MTGKGSIGGDGIVEQGVAAIALGRQTGVGIGLRERASADLRGAAGEAVADALGALGRRDSALVLLLLDTPSSDQAGAIAGAYDVAGPSIPLAGGGAGGSKPAQMHDGRVLRDTVLAIALAPRTASAWAPPTAACRSPPPRSSRALRACGCSSWTGRPAAEVYLERLGHGAGELSDREFEALAVTHPLAETELNGDTRLRHIRWREGASLACATHVPAGAAVEFTHQSPGDIIAAASRAVERSLDALGCEPGAALVFDCAGRKGAIGGASPTGPTATGCRRPTPATSSSAAPGPSSTRRWSTRSSPSATLGDYGFSRLPVENRYCDQATTRAVISAVMPKESTTGASAEPRKP